MKKIGLGIAISLFAIVFALSSTEMEMITLLLGALGLGFAIAGFFEK